MSKPNKTEKPIIFTAESIKAILDGRKTQTRRIVKLPKESKEGCGAANWSLADKPEWAKSNEFAFIDMSFPTDTYPTMAKCRYDIGNLLWARESYWYRDEDGMVEYDSSDNFRLIKSHFFNIKNTLFTPDKEHSFSATSEEMKSYGFKKKPSIFMPRNLSQITLEVTAVRVEQVQDMTEEDAFCEGVKPVTEPITEQSGLKHRAYGREYGYNFQKLWDSINAKRGFSWESNPFVFVIEFEKAIKQ